MKTASLLLILVGLFLFTHPAQQPSPNAIPVIRLDKTRFVLGESVFFWVGVEQTSSAPIPKQYQRTCQLIITSPDNTQTIEPTGWPMDGPPDSGWLGGAGLGDAKIQTGRYMLQFEFAGLKTAPIFLFVENVPIIRDIKSGFLFEHQRRNKSPVTIAFPTDEVVTFFVRNDSKQTVRFPALGGGGRFVAMSMKKLDHSYTADIFYPDEKLADRKQWGVGSTSFDQFSWDVARVVRTITLRPGRTYRKALSLQAAFNEVRKSLPFASGEYRVTFATTLQVLIGEEDGPLAVFPGIRIPVEGSTNYCVNTGHGNSQCKRAHK